MSGLKEDWRRLKRGKSGSRFVDFHRFRCERWAGKWPLERILMIALGGFLFVGGLAIGWLPGPGGFVAVIGAAMLGVEFLPIAKALDWSEVRARDAWRFLMRHIRRGRKQSEP
jgi:hypothetical protein